ncbi:MAG: NAD(+)/NADH kinase [Gordonibacter sp.]|uniref:NAD(+)/NADH kinase n=1 Tax=Gordonibacter sp. TaxID=1968902 RepID=UPI002FC82F7F
MHIVIVRNNSNSPAVDASLLLATYLATQGAGFTLVNSSDLSWRCDHDALNDALAADVQMAVVLGGDGTILRTARQIGTSGVPILGINFGRLGFLANSSEEGVVSIMAAALSGDVVAEQRTNLRIDVVCEGESDPWADDEQASSAFGDEGEEGTFTVDDEVACTPSGFPCGPQARTFFALNELAVTRGANGRIIDFGLDIAGAHVANMRGDGLVVATATGSTAYALSAGGPLVSPGFSGLVVVPLAPHTLHSRAIVTASSDVVEMDLSDNRDPRDATLFADGELVQFDRAVRRVYVRRGDVPTTLLRYQHEGFYEHAAKVFF